MAKENSILQEAILEAKQVREAAISQAYESLKENLTPAIKTMLENKLEEELKLEENAEEELDESVANSGFKEVKVSAPKTEKIEEAEEDDSEKEEAEAAAEDAEADAEDAENSAEDAEKDADKAEEEADEDEKEDEKDKESESEMDDDTKIEDLTVGDLKDLIANIISQSSVPAEPAPEGEMGADMEVADVEGAGEEEAPADVPPTDDNAAVADNADVEVDDEEDGDEIDLAELLRELEDEDKKKAEVSENEIVPTDQRGKQHDKKVGDGKCQDGETEDIDESKDEKIKNLEEGLKKITETLKNVNLTNSKLQYTTRILSEHNLSEAQKATVIRTLDRAKSVKEVKVIYNTLVESLSNAKTKILQEHRGSASRAAGSSTRNNIVDADETVRRMQYLAGIID